MTLVARITFLILVAATFAAFFVAQRLKSEPPVITVGRITSDISPNGDGKRDGTNVSITIKTADEATVDIVDLDGDRVRRLAEGVAMAANQPLLLRWDGKGDDGAPGARRPVPRARRAARRGPLGDRAGHDVRRHARATLRGLHRVPLRRSAQADGEHHQPRATGR